MRENKFRGLNHETGEFVYGYYTKLCSGARKYDAIICDVDGSLTEFYIHDIKTVGQFTGLTDKNGVDIYEGDIFFDGFDNSQIIYDKFKSAFVAFDGNESHYLGDWLSEREIIGNIHQHKEFLA